MSAITINGGIDSRLAIAIDTVSSNVAFGRVLAFEIVCFLTDIRRQISASCIPSWSLIRSKYFAAVLTSDFSVISIC